MENPYTKQALEQNIITQMTIDSLNNLNSAELEGMINECKHSLQDANKDILEPEAVLMNEALIEICENHLKHRGAGGSRIPEGSYQLRGLRQ